MNIVFSLCESCLRKAVMFVVVLIEEIFFVLTGDKRNKLDPQRLDLQDEIQLASSRVFW